MLAETAKVLAAAAVLACLPAAGFAAPDYEREGRLAEEAEAGLFDGDAVYLDADGRSFLSLLIEPEAPSKGAVIVMHGRGFHPDWPQVANPVRVALGERGWTTLSIQMPVLGKGATYYDYLPIVPDSFPRIEAAIAYLRSAGHDWIAMVAHSCSVHMSMAWIRMRGDDLIQAYAGIGMGATDTGQPMREDFPLGAMSVPVLDVFGNEDYPSVIRSAPQRKAAIERAGAAGSMQLIMDGPDHLFEDYEEGLAAALAQWLDAVRQR